MADRDVQAPIGTWLTPALLRKIARFSVSGVLVTLVHIASATAWLQWVNTSAGLANGFAFTVATAFSYFIHTLWSFSAQMEQRVFAKFVAVALVGLGISVGVGHLVQWLGFSYLYSIAAVVLVMPPYNFLAHHFWTYAKPAASRSLSSHHPL